jgi:hypothetical protein
LPVVAYANVVAVRRPDGAEILARVHKASNVPRLITSVENSSWSSICSNGGTGISPSQA